MLTYSDHLIALSRAYDRAVLASNAASWLISDLEADYPDVFQGNDFDLVPWASQRVTFLKDSLHDLHKALCAQIVLESAPFFHVALNDDGLIEEIPVVIDEIIGEYSGEVFPEFEDGELSATKCVDEGKAAIRLAKDHQVILFEGDWFLFPKSIPPGLIEIWWRRYYRDEFADNNLYSLCLVPNLLYGWDCYGHER